MSEQESDLVKKAQEGDVASFEALVERYQRRLFYLVLPVAGNAEDAEDALQEALIQAYRALPRFRGESSFSTWLYRIALNTTRNWIRSQYRASSERIAERLALTASETYPGPEEALMVSERRRQLQLALIALPDHYREAILLRHYQDMTYDEIARVLNVPIGTVRSRIAQARKLLMMRLGPLD